MHNYSGVQIVQETHGFRKFGMSERTGENHGKIERTWKMPGTTIPTTGERLIQYASSSCSPIDPLKPQSSSYRTWETSLNWRRTKDPGRT